uniref:Uncharacterized protein n=1 Tax=Anguilla anguilla TaxID=7936 RepID=A0A0E9WUT3_ANGAN
MDKARVPKPCAFYVVRPFHKGKVKFTPHTGIHSYPVIIYPDTYRQWETLTVVYEG